MKKNKLIIISLLVVFLTGCSTTKEATTKDEFTNVLTESKFTVYESTPDFEYASVALIASKDDAEIVFVEGKKRYDIEGIFIDECKNVYNVAGSEYDSNTHGGKNWTNLTVTNDTTYYFVGWIGNTYVYAESPIEDKEVMKDIIKKLGY